LSVSANKASGTSWRSLLATPRRASALVAATLMMGVIFARSLLVNEPDDSVAALYVIPIALLARDRNRAIIDAANEAFVATDRHGVVQDWNRAAERTYGWTADERTFSCRRASRMTTSP
jgi:PAS domain-containing protein